MERSWDYLRCSISYGFARTGANPVIDDDFLASLGRDWMGMVGRSGANPI